MDGFVVRNRHQDAIPKTKRLNSKLKKHPSDYLSEIVEKNTPDASKIKKPIKEDKLPDVISFEDFLEIQPSKVSKTCRNGTGSNNSNISMGKSDTKKSQNTDPFKKSPQEKLSLGKRKKVRSSTSPNNLKKKRKNSSDNEIICITDILKTNKVRNGNAKNKTEDTKSKNYKACLKTPHKSNKKTVKNKSLKRKPSLGSGDDCCIVSINNKPTTVADKLAAQVKQETNGNAGMVADKLVQPGVLSWCEKFQPQCSDEFMSNRHGMAKLTSWLGKWKERIEKEKRYILKQAAKLERQKNKKSGRLKDGEDSDFRLSDEEDWEETTLCNTYIIAGPHGCGKTTAVHVLAQQAGFKVLEMNASSERSYKQVLSKFQEATQSYLVSGNQLTRNKTTSSNPLASFFGTKSKENKSGDLIRTKTKIEKEKNSLIFLDEVDAVLDGDKGFWSALQWLMNTSKRPILITATHTSVVKDSLTGSYLTAKFKLPKTDEICSTLQSISETESFALNDVDLKAAVTISNHDPRQSITSMQFWKSVPSTKPNPPNCRKKGQRKTRLSDTKIAKPDLFPNFLGISGLLQEITPSTFQELLFKLPELDEPSISKLEGILSHCMFHNLPSFVMLNYIQLLQFDHNGRSGTLRINVPKYSNPNFALHDDIDDDFVSVAYGRNLPPPPKATLASPFSDNPDTLSKQQQRRVKNQTKDTGCKVERRCSDLDLAHLKHLSEYFDASVLCDRLQRSNGGFTPSAASTAVLRDGVGGETDQEGHDYLRATRYCDLTSSLQVRSLKKVMVNLHNTTPNPAHSKFTYQHKSFPYARKYSNLISTLQEAGSAKANIYVDYLPSLRAISRSEELRKDGKFSRRFLHYLGCMFNSGDIVLLSTEFEEVPI